MWSWGFGQGEWVGGDSMVSLSVCGVCWVVLKMCLLG